MPAPEQGNLWGILGGTFDPVHIGHLTLAEDMLRRRDLRGVLLVPAYNHPFKQHEYHASYHDRVAMLRLAAASHVGLAVCEIEAEERLSGYTVDTIRALKARFPDRAFRFIIGADNLEQIAQWHRPDQILAEAPLLAGARPGYRLTAAGSFANDRIELVETAPVDISSSALREMIRKSEARERLMEYLPETVLDYIQKEQLYR